MKANLLAIALCYALVERAVLTKVPVLARQRRTITQLILDIDKTTITSTKEIVSGIDESYPVLIALDVGRNILAYMESWLRSSSGNIRVIALGDSSTVPSYIHRSSGVAEETITSLAIDWVTGKLYVGVETASIHNAGRIEVCPLVDQISCAVALYSNFENQDSRIDALHSLVLDPVDGYMYWLNRVHKRIERAWMDGRHHDPHCFKDHTTDVVATSALTLEQVSRMLYYVRTRTSLDDSQIWRCSLYDRESCRAIASKVNAFYLDLFSDYLIWTSVTNRNSGITVCEKMDCDRTTREVINSSGVEALIVFDEQVQPLRQSLNPCQSKNGGCSHICVLIPGAPWRSCLCPVGVRLLQDRLTCSPNGIERLLYVATTSGLIFISLDTGHHTPLPLPNAASEIRDTKVVHVDFDPIDKKLFMIDGDMGVIRKCNPDGTEMEVFVEDSNKLVSDAVAVDWLNRNLYWLDSNVAQIKMQSLSSKGRQIVISHGLKQPRGLALDPDGGYMFFSDWHESTSRIEKAWLDGSRRRVLVSLEKDAWPNGIVVDAKHKRLYWAEGSRSLIKSVALDGKLDVQVVSESVNHPYSLTILGNSLYCNSLYGRKISMFRIPRHNESFFDIQLSVVSDSVIFGQMGIRAVNLNHIPEGISPCQKSNGGCSHICVKLPNGERGCVCPVGYELQADSTTCIMPTAFLIYTQSPAVNTANSIMRISLEAASANNRRINIADMTSVPVSVDINQNSQRIFWSSEGRGNSIRSLVHSAFFNGSGLETVYEGNAVNYIAVDWITSNIYWCNMEQRRIEMVRGDGRRHRTIAWENIDPRHLVIHPLQRFLVFVNYYNRQKITINKIPLHGEQSGGRVIVRQLDTVNALAIDFDSELLVWSELDERGGGVSISDFSGRSRARLVYSKQLLPAALTVYNRLIYIANMNNNTIDLYNGHTLAVLHDGVSHVTNLAVAHGQISKDWNGCVPNNGGCSDICVAVDESLYNANAKCFCEDHFTLDHVGGKCLPPKHFLLVAIRGHFIRFNLRQSVTGDIFWKDDPHSILSVTNVGSPISVAVDLFSANRSIYWIDSNDDKVIKRSSDLSHSVTQTITLSRRSNCAILFHLAVDEVGRQLFVSCAEHGLSYASSIHVWRIKNNDHLEYIGVVVSGKERSPVTDRPPYPRQIALFPRLNLLFYVDDGGSIPAIVRCSLNGRQCVQWGTPNLTHTVKLHAYQINDRLYYTTANGLWSRDAHVFSDVRHHIKARPSDIDMVPITEKKLIIVAKNESQYDDLLLELMDDIPTVSLDELKWSTQSPYSVKRILALTVVGSIERDFYVNLNHTCAVSHCSHLCRVPRDSRKRHECLCPLGFGLQAPSETFCFKHASCLHWQFKCDDGQECIHAIAKCDGRHDCTDGSDESSHWCGDVAFDKWPCDNRKTSIARTLICNGAEDCADGSDEAHCRCTNPLFYFDCTFGPNAALHPPECINRELICNGVSNCYAGQDEEKQLCAEFGAAVAIAPTISPSFELIIPLAVFFLALSITVSVCCCHFSKHSLGQNSAHATTTHSLPLNAEARVLLPAHPDGTQIEFQFRTYSVGASSSLYNALPPPNSRFSTDAISSPQSLTGNPSERSSMFAAVSAPVAKTNSRRFFAPPPSAASLSTYGVVKPAGMRVHLQHGGGGTGSTRNRRKQRHRARTDGTRTHSPPPSYSKVKTTRPVCIDPGVGCSDEESQQLQVPTNSRIVSSVDSSSVESTKRVLLPSSHFISSVKFAQQQRLLSYSSTSSDVSLE
ncbi:low-density lipoprotein receptor repeat class B containing protein [Loa loa]|uniref:Low-density lipoprotein receptor repeat class B containing protein n=1 Tax=Loa loa TaxID=7209 RepID=A0A1S0U6H9_LOALO|nr:low-density lipoprotein receptor repeat class B containing protein [Loa loa]EFO25858.2 low-density lipoprotein receptor repeat class B containing protein [Loa loa]